MMCKQVFSVEVIRGLGPADVAVTVYTAEVDVDLETEAATRQELSRVAAGTGPIVIDVSEVFVAVAGVRLLLDCVQSLRRAGRPAELVVNRHLLRVAHIVGQPRDMLWLTLPDALDRARTPVPEGSARSAGADGGIWMRPSAAGDGAMRDAAGSDGSGGRRSVRSVFQFRADRHG
jgi:anti-anti-sigma regulatory factor